MIDILQSLMTITWLWIFLNVASLASAMGEIRVLNRSRLTWCPALYTWSLGFLHLDAFHFPRGVARVCGWIAASITVVLVLQGALSAWWLLWFWVLFYQIRNFWLHIGLLHPRNWRWSWRYLIIIRPTRAWEWRT